jgi:transposase InsO family protein
VFAPRLGPDDGLQPDEARPDHLRIGYCRALQHLTKDYVHHTDHGSQYCSKGREKRLSKYGFKIPLNDKRNCDQDSMIKTFFRLIKTVLIWRNRREF